MSLHSGQPRPKLARMRPLIATSWAYALLYWALFFAIYLPEAFLNRRSRKLGSTQDAGSFAVVMGFQIPATAAAYAIAFGGKFGVLRQQRLWFWVGLAIMIAGGWLRRHCFRMLGKSFTAVVVVLPGQQVIERGAYRWIRHPSYSAGFLVYTGTILALGNWVSVIVVLTPALFTYAYRVRVEERALLDVIGEPYRDYMRRTKRFVPMIF
jgi:protein-S-isoprenylcysteine O-methyltransferase Ste14